MTPAIRTRIGKIPTRAERLAQVTTIIWDPDMGSRLALIRMKSGRDQAQFGQLFGITQGTVSRIERGRSEVCPQITVARLIAVLDDDASYVLYGLGPERYSPFAIKDRYWKKRLAKKGKGGAG